MREETYAIEAHGLVKRFGKTTALAGVDLTARAGTVLGLLGPNGAGKTTAVRILATLLRPDGGEARVCGYDVERDAHQVRQLIGLTGQYASVDEGLSGPNNLIMIGRLLGLPRARRPAPAPAELLERFELTDAAGRIAKTYSGGMRRRLDLAASLVGRPRGALPGRADHRARPARQGESCGMIIHNLVDNGVTIFLTTQYLEEADQLAHDIAVIDRGKVIATGTPDELKARTGSCRCSRSPPPTGPTWPRSRRCSPARTGRRPRPSPTPGTRDRPGRPTAAVLPAHRPRARRQGHRARGVRPPQGQPGRGVPGTDRPHRPKRPKTTRRYPN